MAVATQGVSVALGVAWGGEQLLFPVVGFPDFLGCLQIASGERTPSRCTAPKGKIGGIGEEALR